ncbi:MAG: hypothetical protein ACREIW_05380 [Chthoniobacterales bacterium]
MIEFTIGDRVEHIPYPENTLYKPGPGTVTNVSATRVVVLWDDPTWRRPRNYRPHHLKLVTCPWCKENNPRVRSSVNESSHVHTDTPVGRRVCTVP